ncbi:MotA/TolQ/ExbB proton channel family protein [Aromatoleum aromaticum]|uniref:Biopolymer transport protein ExbB n=1 Tax=Aromatoleum aromaticum (strain DSM 19018 / LMG 30748 / EbN1) TaxID=76114 RepID=Q5P6D8_AROAE|nr:MotA/TolQ/ExbB proton channel family protein [Aromatoleum aromaticum]NMG56863.1 MotA/TolQ/ExbB proton channel family protein [Aromatoleum aromaticum]CAI07123.1 MotA/TolQ/ExbB proton channel family protein [Aromatoleum aromaticum EbN1]
MPSDTFGLAHLWGQSDLIIKLVAFTLVVMSVASWYLILVRTVRQFRARRFDSAVEAFWNAPHLDEGLARLSGAAPDSPFEALARQGAAAAEHLRRHTHGETLGGKLDADEFVTRAMRKSIALSTAQLESGLTVLASIGSTAPFVGLFGTVWGIYHALIGISTSGMATLDKVAGPVGEALIMTAFGLFVAIPAVLAFNTFTRANRLELSLLDAFAHDLHAWFTTGTRLASAPTGDIAAGASVNARSATPVKLHVPTPGAA